MYSIHLCPDSSGRPEHIHSVLNEHGLAAGSCYEASSGTHSNVLQDITTQQNGIILIVGITHKTSIMKQLFAWIYQIMDAVRVPEGGFGQVETVVEGLDSYRGHKVKVLAKNENYLVRCVEGGRLGPAHATTGLCWPAPLTSSVLWTGLVRMWTWSHNIIAFFTTYHARTLGGGGGGRGVRTNPPNEPTRPSDSSTSFARLAVLTFRSAKVARLRPVRCLAVVAKRSLQVHTRNMQSHAFCIRRGAQQGDLIYMRSRVVSSA